MSHLTPRKGLVSYHGRGYMFGECHHREGDSTVIKTYSPWIFIWDWLDGAVNPFLPPRNPRCTVFEKGNLETHQPSICYSPVHRRSDFHVNGLECQKAV